MTKAALAKKYRTQNPDKPTKTLAREMYKKEPETFKDLEDARGSLRYIEGKHGKRMLTNVVKESNLYKTEARPLNPFALPESSSEPKKPFKLPTLCNNILLISDLHIPYHDVDAITAALDYGKSNKINTIFINGDLIDFHQLSRFVNDPKKRNVKDELTIAKQVLSAIRAAFPDASIYYLKGNHCLRLEMYMKIKAKELYDLDEFKLESLLELNKHKVTIIDDKQLVKIGKLSVTHGHHVIRGIFAPVNSARGAYMKAKQSTLISHVHKVSEHTETDMDNNMVTCWSTGCLCELKPDYSPLVSNYSHGFAHIIVYKDGSYTVKNIRIHKGKIL